MNFHEWFNALEAKVAETETGKAFLSAGFSLTTTGGNCTAWRKEIAPRFWLFAATCEASHELEFEDEVFGLWYGHEDATEDQGLPFESRSVAETVAYALEAEKALTA